MSNIKLLTVTNAPEHAEVLRRSAELHGWDFTCIEKPWLGFGTKLIETYNYLKEHPGVTEFIFCDAFDVVVFGSEEELNDKINQYTNLLLSTERGLWPPILQPFKEVYFEFEHGFNYINSGLYYAKSKYFLELLTKYPPSYEIDDQYFMNMIWILEHEQGYIDLNSEQTIFNSHSHILESDYGYVEGRIQVLGNSPVFVHKNGRTVDERLDELVKNMLA